MVRFITLRLIFLELIFTLSDLFHIFIHLEDPDDILLIRKRYRQVLENVIGNGEGLKTMLLEAVNPQVNPLLAVSSTGAGKLQDFERIRARNGDFFREYERDDPSYPSVFISEFLEKTEPDLMKSVGSVESKRMNVEQYVKVKLVPMYRSKYNDGMYQFTKSIILLFISRMRVHKIGFNFNTRLHSEE